MNLLDYKELIDMKPIHIATISKDNKPNLSVASDVKIISENKILISHNEMINTVNNILNNDNIVITALNENWQGLRIFGKADYYTKGEYFDLDIQLFKNKTTNPKGAILITVSKVEELK